MQNDGTLRGWVYDRETKKGRVAVGLFAGDILLEVAGEKVEIIQFEDVPSFYARVALMAPGSIAIRPTCRARVWGPA